MGVALVTSAPWVVEDEQDNAVFVIDYAVKAVRY